MSAHGATLSHEWIDQPEGRLRVTRAGEHGDPVVLLSGAGTDNASLSWARLIPVLAERHRVFALDWPKQGGSVPWNGVADHPRMIACVIALLDHYDLATADLVGMSQGGALALATTIEHSERVRRLVAIAPGGIISFPPVVHQLLWLTAKLPLLSRTLPSLTLRNRRGIDWFVRNTLFAGPAEDLDEIVDEILVDVVRRGRAGSSDWQNASIGFWKMNVDLRPRLHTIACPTLFIQGDRDIGVRPKHTRAAAARVPDARLEIVEGAGHWVNRQEPERVNSLVADFLA